MKKKLLFTGPVLTASGYGVHARQLLDALHGSDEFDLYVESLRWGETPFLTDPSLDWIRKLAERPVPQAPDIHVHVSIPNEFKRRAPLEIGVTAGIEVDRVSPQWLLKCNSEVDCVIVPSHHSRDAFMVEYQGSKGEKLRLEKPIFVIHEGVDTAVYRPEPDLSPVLDELGVPGKNFVFTGLGLDKPNGQDRKNVSRLVEFFLRAFKGNPNVGLILKVAIVNGSTLDFEIVKKRIGEIRRAVGGDQLPKIFLVHGRLPESTLARIYNDPRVIASISLTHGEGFGLPLIEAAACGLPVMATNWSGHLDFLNKDGQPLFVPFEHDLQQIPQESVWEGVMDPGTRWAVPREQDVITKMQKMVLNSATPRKWAAELATHISERFSLKATGDVFLNFVRQACAELDQVRPTNREDFVSNLRKQVRERGPSLIYTMPMSAGDVFLSTGVVRALRKRHPGHRVYFATSTRYFEILKDLKVDEKTLLVDELLEWQPWMQDVSVLEDIFDEVYTPNLAVQMTWSNWIHRGKGRNLIDEFATQCGVVAELPLLPEAGAGYDDNNAPDVVIHSGGQKSARGWAHWTELVKNLRANGLKVFQVGAADDLSVGDVDRDLRGKTNHVQLVGTLLQAKLFLGIDSYPMHVANVCGRPIVALFGSSYAATTGPKKLPVVRDVDILTDEAEERQRTEDNRLCLLETRDRNGCDRACYKDVCKVDPSNPCLNNISPQDVYIAVMKRVSPDKITSYKEYRPRIGGYIHILNPKTHGYPYLQSIRSMLGFCDEVVVVDGASTDGSLQELEMAFGAAPTGESSPLHTGKLKIISRNWDPDEPAMDGMQKALARAMLSPSIEFCWQQDADEIVHENDYQKIIDMCKRFPGDVDVVHLPVIELWGTDKHCRTDRHSWKWRLSRNNMRVTHGINSQARVMDPKTGRIYAKPGMSDGCEYIDMVTGDHLPHRGFYTKELEELRVTNPQEYGKVMNQIFARMPSVWHYSWADIGRKIRNFRDFWDKQWQVLYQSPPNPRFPDVVTDDDVEAKATELFLRGGEHGPAEKFALEVTPPSSMKGWIG